MIKDFITYHLKYNYLYRRYLKLISGYLKLSESDYLVCQNNLFISQFRRAYSKSKFYNDLYSSHGIKLSDIESIRDIYKLPIIDKSIIRDRLKDIYIGNRLLKISSHTSGTSGTPLCTYRTLKSIAIEAAYLSVYRKRYGFDSLKDRIVSLRGDLYKKDIYRYDRLNKTLYLSGYNISQTYISLLKDKIKSFAPKALEAYPSSAYELARLLKENGCSIHIPLVFLSSETLYAFQAKLIEEVFTCKIINWYGNSERSISLASYDGRVMDNMPLYSYNEYYDEYVLTSSFINNDFPLIRYKVEDRIILNHNKLDHQGNNLVENIEGRSSDCIHMKDGTIVNRMNQAIKSVKNAEILQIVQDSYEEIHVNIVPSSTFFFNDFDLIKEQIDKRTGGEIRIIFSQVKMKDIIKSKSGKYSLVINNIKK